MRLTSILTGLVLTSCPGFAALSVQLATSGSPSFLVGAPITFDATAAGAGNGDTLQYRFSVSEAGQPYQILIDYNSYKTFVWAPSTHEGSYGVQVTAFDVTTGDTATDQLPVTIKSRVTGSEPVVNQTANPLVALYSVPPCPVGSYVQVTFKYGQKVNQTNQLRCQAGLSVNFYIAGMLPRTTYDLYDSVITGTTVVNGPTSKFKTGTIPSDLPFPKTSVRNRAGSKSATDQGILLIDYTPGTSNMAYVPTATDLNGNVLWYYGALATASQASDFFIRPIAGGTFLLDVADPNTVAQKGQLLREIDLAGNTVRETNVTRINQQLNALGRLGIIDFDHDAIRLSNGHTLAICSQEEIFPAGTQGSTTPPDILGDAIVDLDQNLQVAWSWSGYDHLNIDRPAVLGETCVPGGTGCPPISLAPIANDWLHANSLNYIPSSGDLLLSLRHQDWVLKIGYNNEAGSGNVIWTMGPDGSFAINGTGPYPWFSHQHDVEYELNGTTILSVFDNGNTRAAMLPGTTQNSRGMVLNVDEPDLIVTPILSQDLGVYSAAVGSAQRLDNGDYHFTAGFLVDSQNDSSYSEHFEYSISGSLNYLLRTDTLSYRGYRMDSLYLLDNPVTN